MLWSVVSYILIVQERLERMHDTVLENLEEAQLTQKKWYDHHTWNRKFEPRNQVLVLLPTSTNKLLASFFHINMVRQWHPPSTVSLVADKVVVPKDNTVEDKVLFWDCGEEPDKTPNISSNLSTNKREEMEELLHQFRDVLRNQQGKTHIAEYLIQMKLSTPIRLPPYRLPHTYHDLVRSELQKMKADGVMEPSNSEWACHAVNGPPPKLVPPERPRQP